MLTPGTIYLAHDRFVCTDCAGATARHSHRTIGGAPVLPITAADVAAWRGATTGPFRALFIAGGHFFVNTARAQVIEAARRALA